MTVDEKIVQLTQDICGELVLKGHKPVIVNNRLYSINDVILGPRFSVFLKEDATENLKSPILPRINRLMVRVGVHTYKELHSGKFHIDWIVTALLELVGLYKEEHAALNIRHGNNVLVQSLNKQLNRSDVRVRAADFPGGMELTLYPHGEKEVLQIVQLYDELICERSE